MTKKTRLPDFNTSKAWQEIRQKMGAIETVKLPDLDINGITLSEIKILKSGSISIENIHDHINPLDGTFDFKGQKVILYIKQQYYDMREGFLKSSYKYHLAYCQTLNHMELNGRLKVRYVVTQRTDGKFLVDIIDKFSGTYGENDRLCEMDVCKNCLRKLSNIYPVEPIFNFEQFYLSQFIKKYNTKHIKKPLYTSRTLPKNEYSDNWAELSKSLRKKTNYCCTKCNKSYANDKGNLHVHHKDGQKWNNNLNNLQVLCIKCHSKEPGHAKLKNSSQYIRAI